MREILFRGKRTSDGEWDGERDGEWIEGTLFRLASNLHPFIMLTDRYGEAYEVDSETVGQFTGLTDKNGKKIFEGDIIKTRRSGTRTEKLKGYYGYDSDGYPQKIPGYDGVSEYSYSCQIDCYAKVEYDPTNGGFYLNGGDKFVGAICNEVVGNIHDNPELLENP